MNYFKHYDQLISKARNRILTGYYETHHIIPRCMGGNDDSSNLVDLTPEEHFVAHQLLHKMYPENIKLLTAVNYMTVGKFRSNKRYAWIRKKFAEAQSINQAGENNSQYGTIWIHNKELRQNKKISKSDSIPNGWEIGRKKIWTKKCSECGTEFPAKGKIKLCSDKCKQHWRSYSIRIIDNNLDKMIAFYKTCYAIDRTLKHFGITGARNGCAYFSKILKQRGIRVRPRTIKKAENKS